MRTTKRESATFEFAILRGFVPFECHIWYFFRLVMTEQLLSTCHIRSHATSEARMRAVLICDFPAK